MSHAHLVVVITVALTGLAALVYSPLAGFLIVNLAGLLAALPVLRDGLSDVQTWWRGRRSAAP
ncbi:MAG: hypothetical protein ACQETV_08380 [Actinomycetota bacterium]